VSATISEIWRYPVKSMAGERMNAVAVGERGMHADRMWAVRDPELGSITTARRLPALLMCSARYPEDPVDHPAVPGNAPEVVITLPDGTEVSSSDPQVHRRLSELVGAEVQLEPLPPTSEQERYKRARETKANIRAAFGLADDEPLPDFSIFPLKMLSDMNRYVTPVGSLYDSYPLHLITRTSLASMAALAPGSDFDVRRFRPNLVVETDDDAGLPENAWLDADIELPRATLRGEIPTLRCVMPTRGQAELPSDRDVMRTVAKHARRCLGLYATVARGGVVSVGDELVVRRPGPPSRPVAMARAGKNSLKRGVVRAVNALKPDD
jgi:MOSC domain-containing protein